MATIRDRYVLDIDTKGASANLTKLKGALIAIGGAVVTKQILDVTASFEDLRDSLNVVAGSAEAGGAALERIKDFARTSQFGVEELSKSFIQLKAAGIEPTEKLLRTFTDTAAVTTDQIGSLEAITALLARTTGGGLGLEELERLADRGIPVYRILGEQIGITRQEVSEFGKTAEGARTLVLALLEGLDREFGGATLQRLDNLSTVMSNFQIALKEVANEFGTGLSPAVIQITTQITNFLDANKGLARTIGETLGDALIAISNSIEKLLEQLNVLGRVGLNNLTASLIDGLANFTEGFARTIDAVVNTLRAATEGIQKAVVAISNVPGAGFDAVFIPAGKSRDQFIEETTARLEQLKEQFGEISFFKRGGQESIALQLEIRDLETALQSLQDENVIVFNEMPKNFNRASEAAAGLVESLRASAEGFRENARAAQIAADFPEYDDAILRLVRAQETAKEANASFADSFEEVSTTATTTAEAIQSTKSSYENFYDSLVDRARESVAEQTNAMRAYDDLFAELEAGTLNVDQYALAVDRLNSILGRTSEASSQTADSIQNLNTQLSSAEQFYRDLVDRARDNVREFENAGLAQDRLMQDLESGKINIDQYADAMQQLNSILGTTSSTTREVTAATYDLQGAIDDVNRSTADRIQQAQDRSELAGLRGIRRELRSIELQEKRTAEAAKRRITQQAEAAGVSVNPADLSAIDAASQRAIEVQQQLALDTYNNQRAFSTGWANAFDEYAEQATDAASQAQRIFEKTTRGMEDAIVGFAKTGKFEFKDFLATIAEEILRSQVRILIAKLFGGMGAGGQSGFGTNRFAGFFANGGMIPSGKFGIAGEAGPELITGPAQVTPLGMGGDTVTYNINAVDAPSFQQLVARDPRFIHAVSEKGRQSVSGVRR